VVIPADNVAAAEREGVVEFVSLTDSLNALMANMEEAATNAGFVGANIDAQITVTDATTITIILDPTTGDNLVVNGAASPLYIGITPSGQISMSGRYEITEGRYSMDFYDLVSRQLSIGKGSYIAWTGDPMMADIQIAAIYSLQAAPLELVESQTGGMEQAAMSRYRTQLPFEVYVNITGEMLTPEIGFDIQLEQNRRGAMDGDVESRLAALRQDESELNKQVFALLVLGRFLAPDPLASTGGGLGATARNSLSQVMSDQLNQLTNRYAGGLGLELGVSSYEDYSTGSAEGRTDLNVAMRQQFLNDRLTVRVGTDIGLEGQRESQNNMSGFGGDVSVEYSITSDGRLRVRGFQRNQYEGFLEGDVRATGLALIFVRDYDNFSDLFRNLERREARKQERRMEDAIKFNEREKRKEEDEAEEKVQEMKTQD
jgi:translocation and assembly module TamB